MVSGVEENTKRSREIRRKPHECTCSTGRNDNKQFPKKRQTNKRFNPSYFWSTFLQCSQYEIVLGQTGAKPRELCFFVKVFILASVYI